VTTTTPEPPAVVAGRPRLEVPERIVEIVSDSGEGAQKAGQTFGAVRARMGNGVWTVEIIPAEIKPPARSRAGASGIRVRFATGEVTNRGEHADLVVAFNEQVLYGRIDSGAFRAGTVVLLENKWAEDPRPEVRQQYGEALAEFAAHGLEVVELPLERACLEVVPDARVGKNMFVVGMLCEIFGGGLDLALEEVEQALGKKGPEVVERNRELVRRGAAFAVDRVAQAFRVPVRPATGERVVMNGNQALALGIMASGIELVSMYPITPATSVSHQLARTYRSVGGFLHQAEDEIAAIGFAIGASWAGRTACTITSGPGLALKTEFLGYATMAEIPLVVIDVQRGGPSTGLPTKVEQGDLLAALFGQPGDTPKIVFAPATIEECFHSVVLARRLAEEFRGPVIVLTDANLATGVAPFPRPEPDAAWLAPEPDRGPWPEGVAPYDWDAETGLSARPIPGQRGGEHVVTGLAHTRRGKVAYDQRSNQEGCDMRSRKLAALSRSLKPPVPYGAEQGELLVVGWGSTLGAIREAVDLLRAEGRDVAALHLRFLSPLEPGLAAIFGRFRKVMTVEINFSDDPEAPLVRPENRRMPQLAQLLRERTLVDVDGWSKVPGQPFGPGEVATAVRSRLGARAAGTAELARGGAR
jgi:2-oxoglutarate ferredoxin oxidoreductase subunit alpha